MSFLDSVGLAHFWGKVRTALAGKQDKLTGKAGQLLGFDAEGRASPVDPCYMTAEQVNQAIEQAITSALEETY